MMNFEWSLKLNTLKEKSWTAISIWMRYFNVIIMPGWWDQMDVLQIFPTEIVFKIFGWLDLTSLCLCRGLSRKWRRHVNEYLGSVMCLDFVPYESILTEDGLKHMLSYVNNLRVLHLDSCWPCVTEENLFVIATNCSKLSVLTASRCKGVSDAALETLARYCKQLAELDLSSCFNVWKRHLCCF